MFNLSGSELVFIAILGLIVLGPEKLPAAMRRAGKVYREVRSITGNVQREAQKLMEEPMREVRKMVDEPMQEIRKTQNATKDVFEGKMPHLQPRPAADAAAAFAAATTETAAQKTPTVHQVDATGTTGSEASTTNDATLADDAGADGSSTSSGD